MCSCHVLIQPSNQAGSQPYSHTSIPPLPLSPSLWMTHARTHTHTHTRTHAHTLTHSEDDSGEQAIPEDSKSVMMHLVLAERASVQQLNSFVKVCMCVCCVVLYCVCVCVCVHMCGLLRVHVSVYGLACLFERECVSYLHVCASAVVKAHTHTHTHTHNMHTHSHCCTYQLLL